MKRPNEVLPNVSTNSTQKNMSFHVSMKYILLIAQIFGHMPVKGIFQSQISALKFSWVSGRMFYSLLTLAASIFTTFSQITMNYSTEIKMYDIYKLSLSLIGIFSSVLFIKLAREWPHFVKTWNRMEKAMVLYGWPVKVNRKINTIALVFIILFIVEYGLNQIIDFLWITACKEHLNNKNNNKFTDDFSSISNILSIIFVMYTNFQEMFCCTFVDIFIMVLSVSLAERLKQIKNRIKTAVIVQSAEEEIWKRIREDYYRLEQLCKFVNSKFSWLIILSFLGNISLILIQLFNSLQVRTMMGKIHLYYSFGFLITRTACVCIYGATVNDESRKDLLHLYNLSDSVYNGEVERLIHQISMSNMALSGLNFFVIKRDLTLKIAGALVTYELIIIQFFDELLNGDAVDPICTPATATLIEHTN